MADVWTRWGPVLVTAFLCVPVAIAVGRWRARRIGGRRAFGEVLAICGSLPWAWMLFTPNDAAYRELHLNPLDDLFWYLYLPTAPFIVQFGGNLLVLAAFGAGAPLRWRLNLPAVTVLAALLSTGVEVLQFQLDIGRVASTSDVLLNTAGAVIGAAVTRRWWASEPARRPGTVSVQ